MHFFCFIPQIFPSRLRILILNTDPDPGGKTNADSDPQPCCPGSLLSCNISVLDRSFCPAPLMSCIIPVRDPSCLASVLFSIHPVLHSRIPPVLCPNVLHPHYSAICIIPCPESTFPASLQSSIPPVLHPSGPATFQSCSTSLLSCIPPVMHPSCPAPFLFY